MATTERSALSLPTLRERYVSCLPMSGTNAYFRAFSVSRAVLLVSFPVLWILAEMLRKSKERQSWVHHDSLGFAASDLVKSVVSLFIWFVCWHSRGVHSLSTVAWSIASRASPEAHSELPMNNFHARGQEFPTSRSRSDCRESMPVSSKHPRSSRVQNMRSTLSILIVGLVYAVRAYSNLKAREFIDRYSLYLALPVIALAILFLLRVTCSKSFPSAFWHACVLQFAGGFIARDALVSLGVLPDYNLLIAFVLCNSMWITFADLICGLHRSTSIHLINTVIFAQSSLVHFVLFLFCPRESISHAYHGRFAVTIQVLLLIEAAKDIVVVLIIQYYGALRLGIFISIASTLLMMVDTWKFAEAPYPAFLGCLIAILGCSIFVFREQYVTEQQNELFISIRRYYAVAISSLAALGYVVVVISQDPGAHSSDLSSMWRQLPGPHGSRLPVDCRVPESSTVHHATPIANYTQFNNVLLIVFFSHARYDSNLDFHWEVYADYFPNIVYIGPSSREDKGFAHSYDVLVDSFKSDEDLSDPRFYKMAGRMAHHMLYTALRENGCYDGYLWVPFDTFLNIPRLQQFNQSLFWYHSPWGQSVPNRALGNLTGPEVDSTRHAPPAMISPDTSVNLTATWRGWGPDWWWGDPHVGVSACMDAFHNVPKEMRARLAKRTDGETRLIGGSVDTLYIPGRHRNAFMDVLALFLETDCFLEIATPTTLHLVVPPGEMIQFVDHWWIWQPPFNASFVRQKWAEGYEVDTFHTFHWGERGEDGNWRGDHRHVEDVRHLLLESAERQGLGSVFPVGVRSF